MQPGRQATSPPGCKKLGTVRHFYERPQVISLEIAESVCVHTGETIIIRLRDHYHQQTVDSLEVQQGCRSRGARQGSCRGSNFTSPRRRSNPCTSVRRGKRDEGAESLTSLRFKGMCRWVAAASCLAHTAPATQDRDRSAGPSSPGRRRSRLCGGRRRAGTDHTAIDASARLFRRHGQRWACGTQEPRPDAAAASIAGSYQGWRAIAPPTAPGGDHGRHQAWRWTARLPGVACARPSSVPRWAGARRRGLRGARGADGGRRGVNGAKFKTRRYLLSARRDLMAVRREGDDSRLRQPSASHHRRPQTISPKPRNCPELRESVCYHACENPRRRKEHLLCGESCRRIGQNAARGRSGEVIMRKLILVLVAGLITTAVERSQGRPSPSSRHPCAGS